MTDATVALKISDGTDTRRCHLPTESLSYASLLAHVSRLFDKPEYKVMYLDDEGDKITVSSDEDLVDVCHLGSNWRPRS